MNNQARLRNVLSIMGLSEVEAMNRLQNNGVISDNCVTIDDIADADMDAVMKYLLRNSN